MKEKIIIVICILITGCTKTPTTATVPVIDTTYGKFTIVDNGTTYSDSETTNNPGWMFCRINKQANNSFIFLQTNEPGYTKPGFPISMQIWATGPVSGLGVYRIDSPAANCFFSENFSNGQFCTVDSATVNITNISGDTLSGNYQVWLIDAFGNKTVTGTFNFNNATIY